jgi:hypothetical protein
MSPFWRLELGDGCWIWEQFVNWCCRMLMYMLYMECLYVQNYRREKSESLTDVWHCPAVNSYRCGKRLYCLRVRQFKCCLVLTSLQGVTCPKTWVLGARFVQVEAGPYDTVEPCAICNQTVRVVSVSDCTMYCGLLQSCWHFCTREMNLMREYYLGKLQASKA